MLHRKFIMVYKRRREKNALRISMTKAVRWQYPHREESKLHLCNITFPRVLSSFFFIFLRYTALSAFQACFLVSANVPRVSFFFAEYTYRC